MFFAEFGEGAFHDLVLQHGIRGFQSRMQYRDVAHAEVGERIGLVRFFEGDAGFGLVGVVCLALALLFLISRGLKIALEGPTLFARLLAGAVSLIFFVYGFVNMGMVSGILPVVGVPLPFISYGGTAMVTLGAGLGILQAVARARRLVQT